MVICLVMIKANMLYGNENNSMQPEFEDLISKADTIAYVKVLEVNRPIKSSSHDNHSYVGYRRHYPEQQARVKFLRVLKGLTSMEAKTVHILKPANYYCLQADQELVLYLKGTVDNFITVGQYGGEHRLASAMVDLKNRTMSDRFGVVVSLTDVSSKNEDYEIIILAGRHKHPIKASEVDKYLIKKSIFDKYWIAEIVLQPGLYTILLRDGDLFYYPYQIYDGYYCSVILDKKQHWNVIYFEIEKIHKKN